MCFLFDRQHFPVIPFCSIAQIISIFTMTLLALPLEVVRDILDIAVTLDAPYYVVRLRAVCRKLTLLSSMSVSG